MPETPATVACLAYERQKRQNPEGHAALHDPQNLLATLAAYEASRSARPMHAGRNVETAAGLSRPTGTPDTQV